MRHLVAAGETADRDRFAALIEPAYSVVRVRPLVEGTFHCAVRGAMAGDVRVSVVSGSPCVVIHGPGLVDIAPQGAGDDLADRVLAHCLSHLSEPGLIVESVARALGVSVRYLHKVLAPTGITLSAWIRRQRLERIGRDLADGSLSGRTAGAVAARWGIPCEEGRATTDVVTPVDTMSLLYDVTRCTTSPAARRHPLHDVAPACVAGRTPSRAGRVGYSCGWRTIRPKGRWSVMWW